MTGSLTEFDVARLAAAAHQLEVDAVKGKRLWVLVAHDADDTVIGEPRVTFSKETAVEVDGEMYRTHQADYVVTYLVKVE